jgi:hypothetical protein
MNLPAPRRLNTPTRLAVAAAAVAVTLLLGVGLLGAFHHASPPQWLAARPDRLADLARCDAHPQRAARERCRQQTALRQRGPAEAAVRLAADEPSPADAVRLQR